MNTGNRFVKLFHKFNQVVHACFGNSLDANYKILLEDFFTLIDFENISYTNKLHILKHHIPEFICLKKKSLGFFSEQTFEAVHHDFGKHKKNFQDNSSKLNAQNAIFRSVTSYNSNNFFNGYNISEH